MNFFTEPPTIFNSEVILLPFLNKRLFIYLFILHVYWGIDGGGTQVQHVEYCRMQS